MNDNYAIPALVLGGFLLGLPFGAYIQKRARSNPNVDDVNWHLTRDWTITDSNITVGIEFGFRSDGYMMWRRSSK